MTRHKSKYKSRGKRIFSNHTIILILIISIHIFSASLMAETQPAIFLAAGVGARPLGMGGAFTAISDDASSCYWNPAGMVQLRENTLSGTYARLFLDTDYHFLNYIHHFSRHHISIGWLLFQTEDIEKTDSLGNSLGYCNTEQNAYLLSYATPLSTKLSMGLTLKSIKQDFDAFKNKGWGCDLGILIQSESLPIGIILTDIGETSISGESVWEDDKRVKEYIPSRLRVGTALKKSYLKRMQSPEGTPPPEPLIVEINVPFDIAYTLSDYNERWLIAGGFEVWLNKTFGWRLGWQRKEFKHHTQFINGLSTGCSIKTKVFSVDYALIFNNLFDYNHRISLNLFI